MKKKLKTAFGIVALVGIMFAAPPTEWAAASGHTWQDRQPIRTCMPVLRDSGLRAFFACVITVYNGGEFRR